MKWIKWTEKEPKGQEHKKVSVKFNGEPFAVIFIGGHWHWCRHTPVGGQGSGAHPIISKEDLGALFYLDQSDNSDLINAALEAWDAGEEAGVLGSNLATRTQLKQQYFLDKFNHDI